MNYDIKGILIVFVLLSALASCSGGDDGDSDRVSMKTVQLYVSVPAAAAGDGTRFGDPGTATGEGEDWNTLTLMLDYTDGSRRRMMTTLTAVQFNSLPSLSGNAKIKRLTLSVPEGKARIYGVTYTTGVNGDISDQLTDWEQKQGNITITGMTIPNNYAEGDADATAKMLSVATGFYDGDSDGEPDDFEMKPATGDGGLATPVMRLTRLAAKIDIQWDAEEAYGSGYTDVSVDGFTYYNYEDATPGDTSAGGTSGSGYLFPGLKTDEDAATEDGWSAFYNTTAISKRNGRVYHYVFPNGKKHEIHFSISAKENGTTEKTNSYTFEFDTEVKKATWYKINTTIRGLANGSSTITISPDAGGETTATD